MTKRNTFLFLILFLTAAVVPARAEISAKQAVETFMSEIRAGQTQKANAYLDLETLSKKALTSHWDSSSAEDRKAFLDLMSRLIEVVAYPKSRRLTNGVEVIYEEPQADDAGMQVQSVIKQQEQGLDIQVLYHLHSASDGSHWKIDDVILDDVSVTEDLQYQFDKIITDSGFAGLLKKMQERLDKAKNEPPAPAAAPAA